MIYNDTNGKFNQALKESTSTSGQVGLVILNPDGSNVGGSGGTSSSFGSAFPATGTAIGFKDSTGTNMVAGNLDASGFLKVNVAAGGGSGGTSSTYGAAFPATGTAAGFSDGANMRAAYVAAFHNSDNQAPASSQYGLLTGGIAQILNPSGNLDRQRGTGFDNIPAVGVATGTQQLKAGAVKTTTFNGAVTGSGTSQTITVASTTNLIVGDMILTSDNAEYAEVLTIPSGTTFTAILKNNHANGQSISWNHYNQAVDATIGDNTSLTGISPSATYLYNNISGNLEFDRSAKGELDGASGQGTAVAAEYEYNGQPLANGNVLSGMNFDRARNVQAGGLGSGTISNNPLAANSTTLTLNSAPTTLQPGAQIILDRAGANPETNYVGTGYTPGSTTVPLQIATINSHALNSTVEWSQHAPLGPQLNGFLPAGLGMEEEIVYDPVSKKYFVEIAATADANSGQNIVLENAALYNGSTFDRERGVIGDAQAATGIGADSVMLWNGATYDRFKSGGVTGAAAISGDTASGSSDAGNPVKVGYLAKTALPTAVTDAQRANGMSDKFGRQITIPYGMRDIQGTQNTTISTTTETTIVTAAASIFNDITCITVSNTSATATRVDIRDTTAGTVIHQIYVPAGDVRGIVFTSPLGQTSVNTNWTAQLSTAVTDVRIFVQYIKNK